MKKFTENINENVNRYAGNQIIYNEINNIINETLTPKMDGENSEKISLIGQDSLVKELSKIVENNIIKTKINILEDLKKDPTLIQEKKVKPIIQIKDDYKKIATTIQTIKTKKQAETVEKLIANFIEKYENIGDNMGTIELIKFDRESDIDNRVKELKDALKDKLKSIKDKEIKTKS